jgi:hypothetical protein
MVEMMSIERGVTFLQFLIYEQHEMDGDTRWVATARPVGGDRLGRPVFRFRFVSFRTARLVVGDRLVETGWWGPVGGDRLVETSFSFPFRFVSDRTSRTRPFRPPKPPADGNNTMASAPLVIRDAWQCCGTAIGTFMAKLGAAIGSPSLTGCETIWWTGCEARNRRCRVSCYYYGSSYRRTSRATYIYIYVMKCRPT